MVKASLGARTRGHRSLQLGLTRLSDVLLLALRHWHPPDWRQLRQGPTAAWALGSGGAIALLVWDWRLCLATGSGIGIMLLVAGMQQRSWQKSWIQIHHHLKGMNRPIVLALASGGVASLSTYMAAAIWRDASSPWLATGAILQGAGTFSVLVLLVWLILQRQLQVETDHFQRLVSDLTAADHLKRLIAIRQLIHLCQTARLEPTQRRMVGEYLQLLLHQEQEAVIQNAALDGLQVLSQTSTTLSPRSSLAKSAPQRRSVTPGSSSGGG